MPRTQGEIEAEVSSSVNAFLKQQTGRGATHSEAHLCGRMLLVRMEGVLSTRERYLLERSKSPKADTVTAIHREVIAVSRLAIDGIAIAATDCKPISLHHDLCTSTGVEVLVITLDKPPATRLVKPS
jgi:uncharacterized protein YbcI